jgi:hypothetical protein
MLHPENGIEAGDEAEIGSFQSQDPVARRLDSASRIK